jgi:hypothetical protein
MRDTQTRANRSRKLAQNTTENPKKKEEANTVARGATHAGADEKPAGKLSEVAERAGERSGGVRAR